MAITHDLQLHAPPRASWARGYCEETLAGDGQHCISGETIGTWSVGTLHECLSHCAACAACNYLSWSKQHADCSWFSECNLQALRTQVPDTGHWSFQLRNATPEPRRAKMLLAAQNASSAAAHRLDCIVQESRSFHGEDRRLLALLLGAAAAQPPGRFVELGAFDGVAFSNTIMLERCFGWTGELIEASPQNFAKLRRCGRPRSNLVYSAVCGGNGGTIRFTTSGTYSFVNGVAADMSQGFASRWHGGGQLSNTEEVPCKPLTRILAEARGLPGQGAASPQTTFLSLDVEGGEERVLRHTHAQSFQVIMVEFDGTHPARERAITQRLLGAGLRRSRTVGVQNSRVFVQPSVEGEGEATEQHRTAAKRLLTLPRARPGYCAPTDFEQPGDCTSGASGSWRLGPRFNVSACMRRCALECSRCRYVTISLVDLDCSWYATCPDQPPTSTLPGADHFTVRIRPGRARPAVWSAA